MFFIEQVPQVKKKSVPLLLSPLLSTGKCNMYVLSESEATLRPYRVKIKNHKNGNGAYITLPAQDYSLFKSHKSLSNAM